MDVCETSGRIIKGVGGFYEILLPDGQQITCKARGRFRKEGTTPMVGDMVDIQLRHDGESAIEAIHPRKNALLRPPVANIDQLVIVAAASAPKPDWLLVDKLILQSEALGIHPLLVLNKLDEKSDDIVSAFLADYGGCFQTLCVSSRTGEGMDALKARLTGRISCFAGQSAVGKSSLLNGLLPELALEVGGLAKRTDRGRHTTRHAELWPAFGGAVLDTPGFSLLEQEDLTQALLDSCYPEFGDAPKDCRFAGCRHMAEPDCGVKKLLETGRLSAGRYDRYCMLANEIEQRRKHQYD